ncbi:MAG: cation transporter, partial [Bacteroidales bacterium]
TTFRIKKMDCPSEEQMIRMKLDGLAHIQSMEFDIPKRQLVVYHEGNHDEIFKRLNNLKFNTSVIETAPVSGEKPEKNNKLEKKLLLQVMFLNLFFFVVEASAGLIARSMGLLADSLDMLADSLVYGLALLAVGGTLIRKKNIAKSSGYLQLALAALGLTEAARRFLGFSEMPNFQIMIIISILALIGNIISLLLLQQSKSKEVHMRASMIFTSNDVIANTGMILAGALVSVTNSAYPDLIIAILIFGVVMQGAFRILQFSK